jgi:HEAT repeat protein
MKRLILCALLSFAVSAVFADEELDFYINQFNNASTVVEQLPIVNAAIDQDISEKGEFCAEILGRLLSNYPNIKAVQEFNAAEDIAIILVRTLGDLEYTDAGQNVWKVVRTFSNPIVKSEALMALGKMNATDLLPLVVQTLSDTNSKGPANRLSGERIAYGAIISLGSYKDSSGYLPVFFAANSWYSGWIKKQAFDTLPQLQDDPSEQLTNVIQSAGYTYDQKFLALRAIASSDISDSEKSTVALSAFHQGWYASTNDIDLLHKLISMRKLAINMISLYGSEDETVYGLLNRSYLHGADEEEQLSTAGALSKIATDEAVDLLGTYITALNERHARRIFGHMDERRIRALIIGLGESHNQKAKFYLQSVLTLNWTNQIVKLAKQAIDDL